MSLNKADKAYKFQAETREEWKTCPYCDGQQLAEVFLGHGWKHGKYHLCLKCRGAIYNRLGECMARVLIYDRERKS